MEPMTDRGTENMAARLANLESELHAVRERNDRVTAEKAWEISGTRRMIVSVLTYGFASALLWAIGDRSYLIDALVPTIGYLISTLTIPYARRRWISRFTQDSIVE